MNTHRFILQPYKGPGSRHTCPSCHKRRCFSRYIDTENKIQFPENVGRCDHEQSCGYHLTPKQYFEQNPSAKPHDDFASPSMRQPRLAVSTGKRKDVSTIGAETVSQTLRGYGQNNLFQFLRSRFGAKDTERLMAFYKVGTSKHWPGSCVFWQTDIDGHVRTGKVMLYDAETGKRVKHPFNHVTWVHSLLKLPDFNLRQCFFGEHLLPMNRGKPVAIVESEKTALIASYYLPEYVWLATGGKNGCFNIEAVSVLHGRDVMLYPDLGATEQWRSKLSMLRSHGLKAEIFSFLEDVATEEDRTAGLDIADYLLRIEPDEAVLQSMIKRTPWLQKLIDDLDLELVSVDRFVPETDANLQPQKTFQK